jgi:hypothetical protein
MKALKKGSWYVGNDLFNLYFIILNYNGECKLKKIENITKYNKSNYALKAIYLSYIYRKNIAF